jgi:hypothetical protein
VIAPAPHLHDFGLPVGHVLHGELRPQVPPRHHGACRAGSARRATQWGRGARRSGAAARRGPAAGRGSTGASRSPDAPQGSPRCCLGGRPGAARMRPPPPPRQGRPTVCGVQDVVEGLHAVGALDLGKHLRRRRGLGKSGVSARVSVAPGACPHLKAGMAGQPAGRQAGRLSARPTLILEPWEASQPLTS